MMEEDKKDQVVTTPKEICDVCHQDLQPSYYFCPNCGTRVTDEPLPTTTWAQTKLYVFSAILPLICYLAIGKWKGLKYLSSKDKEVHTVGIIAFIILILSTVTTIWLTYVSVEKFIQLITSTVTDMTDI